ncbi:MAG: DUF2325 domain-containing protein [Rhodoferax sp.]|nr:DUF2325 domain-containing protein [Rhodoferax sp.]
MTDDTWRVAHARSTRDGGGATPAAKSQDTGAAPPASLANPDALAHENAVLGRHLAASQARAAQLAAAHRRERNHLQQMVVRLRAEALVRTTEIQGLRDDLARLRAVPPGPVMVASQGAAFAAADRVICRTGCISHGAHWRVKDQCRRTGKRCVYIEGSAQNAPLPVLLPALLPTLLQALLQALPHLDPSTAGPRDGPAADPSSRHTARHP